MEYDRYQKFRQETYQMLGKAKDATFELMDSVLKDTAVTKLSKFYRGWAGLSKFEQIVDREL